MRALAKDFGLEIVSDDFRGVSLEQWVVYPYVIKLESVGEVVEAIEMFRGFFKEFGQSWVW